MKVTSSNLGSKAEFPSDTLPVSAYTHSVMWSSPQRTQSPNQNQTKLKQNKNKEFFCNLNDYSTTHTKLHIEVGLCSGQDTSLVSIKGETTVSPQRHLCLDHREWRWSLIIAHRTGWLPHHVQVKTGTSGFQIVGSLLVGCIIWYDMTTLNRIR